MPMVKRRRHDDLINARTLPSEDEASPGGRSRRTLVPDEVSSLRNRPLTNEEPFPPPPARPPRRPAATHAQEVPPPVPAPRELVVDIPPPAPPRPSFWMRVLSSLGWK